MVLTPGGSGEKAALHRGVPLEAVVQCSNFFDRILPSCVAQGFHAAVVLGQIGKMSKLASGIMNTHSRLTGDQAITVACLAEQAGLAPSEIEGFASSTGVVQAFNQLNESSAALLAQKTAVAASRQCSAHVNGSLEIGTVILSRAGEVLGYDPSAARIWRNLSCRDL